MLTYSEKDETRVYHAFRELKEVRGVIMHIWIRSPHIILAESLAVLVQHIGFTASLEPTPDCEVALWDLTSTNAPFPNPPALPTLAMICGDEADAIMLLQLHYRGYLGVKDSSTLLKQALQAVRRGEIWADRQTLTKVLDGFSNPGLTGREQEVLRLLTRGLSNRVIGEELDIKEGTVKMHVSRLFAKLDVNSRSELMAQFIDR